MSVETHRANPELKLDPAGAATQTPWVTTAHSGKQHAYHHAVALQRLGCLHRFVTSSFYHPGGWPDRLATHVPSLDVRLRRRADERLSPDLVTRRWTLEVPELVARATLGNGALAGDLMCWRDARFDHWVAKSYAYESDLFWGFQGSCLESLRSARNAGRVAVCEFATAHVTLACRILSQEAERHPEWADSISNLKFRDWYRERLEQEPHTADYCIAASSFTERSLREVGIPEEKIRRLPLGADLRRFRPVSRSARRKFRVLFVGGIGQRKGIKYLLQAYDRVRSESTELVLVGPIVGAGSALREQQHLFEYRGRLDQAGVVHEMQQADVLVLPSVFEGFGLVIVEAMATGMPVIASTHTVAPDLGNQAGECTVIEPSDVEGLATALEGLACNPGRTRELGAIAAERSSLFSWDFHRRRLQCLIAEIAGLEGLPERGG